MKCDKCGSEVNPGDQICINCGAKLSEVNMMHPSLETLNITKETKKDKKKNITVYCIIGTIILIVIIAIIFIKRV